MNEPKDDKGPPEGDRTLAELRDHLLSEVKSDAVPAKITGLAEELLGKLDGGFKPVSSEIRRPRK